MGTEHWIVSPSKDRALYIGKIYLWPSDDRQELVHTRFMPLGTELQSALDAWLAEYGVKPYEVASERRLDELMAGTSAFVVHDVVLDWADPDVSVIDDLWELGGVK